MTAHWAGLGPVYRHIPPATTFDIASLKARCLSYAIDPSITVPSEHGFMLDSSNMFSVFPTATRSDILQTGGDIDKTCWPTDLQRYSQNRKLESLIRM